MESGTLLAHYRLGDLLGRGGMGEVYRARDTKLDRDVALKILPPEFAADAERLARFEREARMLASLNHPNIASIYGFETAADRTFLVMELVEGRDLAELLRDGPLSVDDAVAVARQIAEGLEEAHEKGIVHRDLKPANVKRTPDGKVKVLDFGLARAFAGQTAVEENISSAPTLTAAMTQVGAVLGTAAYMSPEQARGKEVDRRADIWAFGVILFEMLTGRQLFVGETASDTLAGILKSEPDWDELPANLPYQVQRVLRRCLSKDPRQRLRDIGEARVRLENPEVESGLLSGAVAAVTDDRPARGSPRLLPWALLALSLAAVGWFASAPLRAPAPPVLHVALPAPDDADFHLGGSFPGLPEISPDGSRIVFGGIDQEDNGVQLYVRSLTSPKAVALSDTRDAQYPFWSPDGRWVAYYVRNEGLMKIMVDGGPPQLVCEAGNGKGGSWNRTDDLLFTTDYNTPIFSVNAAGGEVRPVTDLENDEGFNSHRHPQFLPDGRRFLYMARGNGKVESQIRIGDLDGGPTKVVMTSSTMAVYASGHLLYESHGALVARPFDPRTGELSGSPTPLVQDVLIVPGAAKAAFSVSTEGTLSYLQGESAQEATLVWRDRRGSEIEQVGETAGYDMVTLSPDERSAAVGVVDDQAGTWGIWIVDLARSFGSRFTFDPADETDLIWSGDGRGIYFTSDRDGDAAIYRKEVGSPQAPRLVFGLEGDVRLWDVSADDRTIIYSHGAGGTAWDLWAAELREGAEPRLLHRSAENDAVAALSPDERWISFATQESGVPQVYVAPWPAMVPITQVSTTTGTWSAWSRGGAELVYQETSGRIMAVSMTPDGDRMQVGMAQHLFSMPTPSLEGAHWSMAADGERFLTVNTFSSDVPTSCQLVLGWPRLLAGR